MANKWAWQIRSNLTYYSLRPLLFNLPPVADGPVNGYVAGIDPFWRNSFGPPFIVGGPKSGKATAFSLRRRQQPVYGRHPVNNSSDIN